MLVSILKCSVNCEHTSLRNIKEMNTSRYYKVMIEAKTYFPASYVHVVQCHMVADSTIQESPFH